MLGKENGHVCYCNVIGMDGLMCALYYSNCNVTLPDLVSSTSLANRYVIEFLTQLSYKQLPFAGCKIALFGFKEEEELDMVGIAERNGKKEEIQTHY